MSAQIKLLRLYLKNLIKAKIPRGIAQVVECLTSKKEAPDSIPKTAKRAEKERRETEKFQFKKTYKQKGKKAIFRN
jgi:hypothetical protein